MVGATGSSAPTSGPLVRFGQVVSNSASELAYSRTPNVLAWVLALIPLIWMTLQLRAYLSLHDAFRLVPIVRIGTGQRRRKISVIAVLLIGLALLPGSARATEIASTGVPAIHSPVGSAQVPNLPPGPTSMAMARFTMDPGGKLEDFGVPGPELIVIESGTVTVGVRGETEDEEDIQAMLDLLQRATPVAGPAAQTDGDLFSYVMHAGDRLLVPPDMPQNVRNTGSGPASFLAAAITPVAYGQPELPWPPAGVSQRVPATGVTMQPMSVGYDIPTGLDTSAATMAITQVTFAPGATYTISGNDVPQLWYIEQGSMQFSGSDQAVWFSKPASSWYGVAAATPTPAPSGFLVAGDAVQLQDSASLTFSSAGSGPVVATTFTVTTEQPSATPAA